MSWACGVRVVFDESSESGPLGLCLHGRAAPLATTSGGCGSSTGLARSVSSPATPTSTGRGCGGSCDHIGLEPEAAADAPLLESRRQREKKACSWPRARTSSRPPTMRASRRWSSSRRRRRRARSAGEGLDDGASAPRDGHLPRDALPQGVEPVSSRPRASPTPATSERSCAARIAFGASVALSQGCAGPTRPKAVRASAGAVFRVPIASFDEPRGRGSRSSRTEAAARGARARGAVTYVLGAERDGLPNDVVAACDESPTIPLSPGAESLNVAIAAAIALYEHRRGR